MITVVWLFIAAATTVAVHVAGLELEATEGHNVSMHFETGLERVDEVRISFEGESKGERLLVRYCFPTAVLTCHPIKAQHLQVEGGNVSLILLKVNSSSSGLYTAQVITDDNQVFEVTAMLVVNQAPVSFTTAPPHSSPTSLSSSDLRGLYALIPAVIIIIILCFYFWKLRKKSYTADEEEATGTPAVSRSSVSTKNNSWKKDCGGCVAVTMNGCGENAEALLAS